MMKSLLFKLDLFLPSGLSDQVDLSTLFRARFVIVSTLFGILVLGLFFSGTIILDLGLAVKLRSFFAILTLFSLLIVLKTKHNDFKKFLNIAIAIQIFLLLVLIYVGTFIGHGFGFFTLIWLIPLFLMSVFYFKPLIGFLFIFFNIIMIGFLTKLTHGSYFKSFLYMPNFEAAFLLTLFMVLLFSSMLALFITQLNELLKDELVNKKSLLEESAKFQSLGQMASNLAHDINNPLFSIQGKLHQMRNLISQNKLDLEKCDVIVEEVEATILKLSQIVKGITTFARQGTGDQMVSVNVEELIQGITLLAGDKMLQYKIDCKIEVQPHTYLICYPSYISRVLINLINNAFDALENVENKKIEILALINGKYIDIHVRDNGPGVDPAIAQNIFESFFTTKKVGKGTGLGLSISMGLVKLHEGTLTYSRRGEFSDFLIRLPSYE